MSRESPNDHLGSIEQVPNPAEAFFDLPQKWHAESMKWLRQRGEAHERAWALIQNAKYWLNELLRFDPHPTTVALVKDCPEIIDTIAWAMESPEAASSAPLELYPILHRLSFSIRLGLKRAIFFTERGTYLPAVPKYCLAIDTALLRALQEVADFPFKPPATPFFLMPALCKVRDWSRGKMRLVGARQN